MKYKLLGTITIISLSASPVIAMESNKLTISKDKLTPTEAINEIVPIMTYSGETTGKAPQISGQVYTQDLDILVPTMTPKNVQ